MHPELTTLVRMVVGMGVVIPKNIITGSFKYAEQNGYFKILIEYILEMMGVGGNHFCLSK